MASATVRDLWQTAGPGRLPPCELMKIWAWKEVCSIKSIKVNASEIARRLKKGDGEPPCAERVREVLAQIDEDPDWYPGKSYRESSPGPKPALNDAKRRCIALSAMATKQSGGHALVMFL